MEPVIRKVKHKLKDAVKAKLTELGHRVDNQLPAYVMVLLTNGRSKKEMDKGLRLFLGDDTDHFTTWLQAVGEKLKEVNIPISGKSSSSKRKSSSSSSDSGKKKRKKKKKDVESDSVRKSRKKVQKIDEEGISNMSIERLEAEIKGISSSLAKSDKTDRKSAKSSKVKDSLKQEEATSSSKVSVSGDSSSASSTKRAERKISGKTQKTAERKSTAVQLSAAAENVEKSARPRINRQAIRAAQTAIFENLQVEEVKSESGNRKSSSAIVKPKLETARIVELKPKDEGNTLPDARQLLNRKRRLMRDKSSHSSDEGYRYEKQVASRVEKRDSRYEVDRSKLRKERSPPIWYLSSSDDETAHGKRKADRQEQSKLKYRDLLFPESGMKRIKRTVTNDKCTDDENTGEDEEDVQEEQGERIVVVESTERGNVNERTVELVGDIAPKLSRPNLFINESGSVNLVRKAFAEVQKSVSGTKYVEKERGSVTITRNIQEDTLEVQTTSRKEKSPVKEDKRSTEMVELSESLQTRKTERCKFWPSCLNGESCLYIHPTILCNMFPNCKFGDACLYIHPKCKFDALCSRFDCPYLHTDKSLRKAKMVGHATFTAGGAPFKSAVFQQPCKYFPNCTNAMCPYLHPKLCRYDKRCQNKYCPFTHTSFKHAGSTMKWVNPGLAATGTSTAASSDQ